MLKSLYISKTCFIFAALNKTHEMVLEVRILLEKTLNSTFRATYVDNKETIHGVLMVETPSYDIAYIISALDLATKMCRKELEKVTIYITNRIAYNALTGRKNIEKGFLKEYYRPVLKEIEEIKNCEVVKFVHINS